MLESFLDFAKLVNLNQDAIHSICLQDVRYGILEIEPGTWMCIGVNTSLPTIPSLPPSASSTPPSTTNTGGTTTPVSFEEQEDVGLASRLYRTITNAAGRTPQNVVNESTHPPPASVEALRSVLHQTYDALRFLFGSFSSKLTKSASVEDLQRIRVFFRRVVPWCLRSVCFETLHCQAFHEIDGVEHLPVDRSTFLRIQGFTESFWAKFHASPYLLKRKMLVLHSGMMVWSSLPPKQARQVVRFIARLLQEVGGDELQQQGVYLQLGAYHDVIVIDSLEDKGVTIGHQGSRSIAPMVYLPSTDEDQQQQVRIVAFKRKKSILVFFLRPNVPSSLLMAKEDVIRKMKAEEQAVSEILQRIQLSIATDFERLCDVMEEGSKRLEKDTLAEAAKRLDSAFIYSNPTNLVVKVSSRFQQWAKSYSSSIFQANPQPLSYTFRLGDALIPYPAIRGFDLVRNHLRRLSNDDGGFAAAIFGDWCIVGCRSGTREIYRFSALTTTLPSSSASQEAFFALPQMQMQLERLIEAKFANVLMI